jgi:putative toxin-antitoxin system antitoxin component (TIGR02293 family)
MRNSGSGSSPSHVDGGAARRRKLGEILVAGGAITDDQLTQALAQQAELGLPLGQTLLKLGYTSDEIMRQALSSQLGVPYIDLQHVIIDRSLAGLLDRDYARQHALFPVARIGRTLTIAMDDPTQTSVVEDLAATTGHTVTVVTSSADAIQRAIGRLYDKATPKASTADRPAEAAAEAEDVARPDVAITDAPHGYVALLGLTTFELPDLLRSIEGGLAYRAFEQLVRNTGLSEERAAELADIGRRALAAGRHEGRFTRDESDRLVRAARIVGGAIQLFDGDRATAMAWLISGQPTLGGNVPLELGRTDLGAREVERALETLRRARTRR